MPVLYRTLGQLARPVAVRVILAVCLLAMATPVFAGVGLLRFDLAAGPGPDEITVEWETETESNVVAFQVRRNTTPSITGAPVVHTEPARGSATSGADYTFVDDGLVPGTRYFYWLVEVRPSGGTGILASDNLQLPGSGQGHSLRLPVISVSR